MRPTALERFAANRAALAGAALLALVAIAALAAPAIAPYDPLAQNLARNYEPAGREHLLGTDHLGRDNLSRLIYGARVSLGISLVAVGAGLLAGLIVGFTGAYVGGAVDRALMRLMDVLLAFPDILLAITIVAILGKGTLNTVIAVAVFAVPTFARLARGAALGVIEQEYVHASRALGASPVRMVIRHILPNCLSPIVVQTTIMLGTAILIASGLSFLGLGVQPPDPEWGAMLSKGREIVRVTPVGAAAPGVAITLVVLSFSMVGDGLRDALDPKSSRRRT